MWWSGGTLDVKGDRGGGGGGGGLGLMVPGRSRAPERCWIETVLLFDASLHQRPLPPPRPRTRSRVVRLTIPKFDRYRRTARASEEGHVGRGPSSRRPRHQRGSHPSRGERVITCPAREGRGATRWLPLVVDPPAVIVESEMGVKSLFSVRPWFASELTRRCPIAPARLTLTRSSPPLSMPMSCLRDTSKSCLSPRADDSMSTRPSSRRRPLEDERRCECRLEGPRKGTVQARG